MRAAVVFLYGCALCLGCALSERDDFLVGRSCDPVLETPCDDGQACLPHAYDGVVFDLFWCRDTASFSPERGLPLAYCDPPRGFVCPGGLVCNADRVRQDASLRSLVCKTKDDLFGPPVE